MNLVYSTARADIFKSGIKTSYVTMTIVKRLLKWVKKYKKFGAYAEVKEVEKDRYEVDIYCPKIYVDKLGNMVIKPLALLRTT